MTRPRGRDLSGMSINAMSPPSGPSHRHAADMADRQPIV